MFAVNRLKKGARCGLCAVLQRDATLRLRPLSGRDLLEERALLATVWMLLFESFGIDPDETEAGSNGVSWQCIGFLMIFVQGIYAVFRIQVRPDIYDPFS
jgi:hypothetical protein